MRDVDDDEVLRVACACSADDGEGNNSQKQPHSNSCNANYGTKLRCRKSAVIQTVHELQRTNRRTATAQSGY